MRRVDPTGELDSLPQDFVDFFAGAGDSSSAARVPWLREQLGIDGGVDECSAVYGYGDTVAGVASSLTPGGAARSDPCAKSAAARGGETMRRPLTESEKMVVSRMAEQLPEPQRSQIVADLKHATAEPLNQDGSILRFSMAGYQPIPRIGRTVSVDAVATDSDGAHLNVILFTDENGRLYELEIVRFESGSVIAVNWETLRFY